MVKFTTIIPSYNNEATLRETLQSIVEQQRGSDEIIVVDDGSTDNSAAAVRDFQNVRYIRQDNSGVSVARNTGIEAAANDWIALCDGDDIWTPEKLLVVERCIHHLPQCEFFFHDFFLFGHGRKTDFQNAAESADTIFPFFLENSQTYRQMMKNHHHISLTKQDKSTIPLYYDNIFQWLILGNIILPSSIVFHRRLYRNHGGFSPDFRSAEETEFFLRLAKKMSFGYIDMPLAGYRKSRGGLTGNIPFLLGNAEKALRMHTINDTAIYRKYKKNINLAFARRYSRLASHYLKTHDRRSCWTNLGKGVKHTWYEKHLWKVFAGSLLPFSLLHYLLTMRNKIHFSRKKN
jgi:glycosyltransferase involved in cell wall biosynthesis